MLFRHAARPDISDVINWYIRMPQTLKYIHLRHSVRDDYFVESESSCFTILKKECQTRGEQKLSTVLLFQLSTKIKCATRRLVINYALGATMDVK
jgi:hypothetical protein